MDGHTCPHCAGSPTLLGELGTLAWLRCRQCGTEWNVPVAHLWPPDDLAEAILPFWLADETIRIEVT